MYEPLATKSILHLDSKKQAFFYSLIPYLHYNELKLIKKKSTNRPTDHQPTLRSRAPGSPGGPANPVSPSRPGSPGRPWNRVPGVSEKARYNRMKKCLHLVHFDCRIYWTSKFYDKKNLATAILRLYFKVVVKGPWPVLSCLITQILSSQYVSHRSTFLSLFLKVVMYAGNGFFSGYLLHTFYTPLFKN